MESPIHKNKWFQLGSVAAVAFAGGSIGGYVLGKRQVAREVVQEEKQTIQLTFFDGQDRPTTTYSEEEVQADPELKALLEEEEQIAQRHLEGVQVVGSENSHTPLRLAPEIPESVEAEEDLADPIERVRRVNVFAREDDDWDWEMELQSRHQEIPYVIHQEEFVADDFGFRQETLTYYVGDDIMADPTDTPIYDYAGLMGELKFGHGSKDPNVVYIRNEKIHMEWEILRHEGMFSVEVYGLEKEKEVEEELRHSHRSPQKFRRSD